jgi:hypothetical protein
MIRILLPITLIISSNLALAQNTSATTAKPTSDRDAIIKQLVAQDRGDITAMEPSSTHSGGVIVGYSSGAVIRCKADLTCNEFTGTPNVAVEQLAVSRRGASEIVWVSYRQGAMYQCMDGSCQKVALQNAPVN